MGAVEDIYGSVNVANCLQDEDAKIYTVIIAITSE